jgi:hypothetical protein
MRPYLKKKIHHKKELVKWLKGVGPEFKSKYHKKMNLAMYRKYTQS